MSGLENKDIYSEGLTTSYHICLLYEILKNSNNKLVDLQIFKLIEDYIVLERNIYNCLSLEEVNKYLDEIDNLDSEDDLVLRYRNKLLLRKFNIYKADNASFVDYLKIDMAIASVITINAIALVYKKMELMKSDRLNTGDKMFLDALYKRFNRFKYEKLAHDNYIEDYALNYGYDFSKVKAIDLDNIPSLSVLNSLCIPMANNAIKNLIDNHTNKKNSNTVLEDLYYYSILEVVLSITDYQSLNQIIEYCNNVLTRPQDYQFEAGCIRRLIYNRKDELEL